MSKIRGIIGPMRPNFLLLTPACVLLGLGTAILAGGRVNPWHFVLAMAAALSSHVSVNAFNEYFDFRSGLDFRTQRTPFSGGTGTLPALPHMAGAALFTSIASLAITGLIGAWFLLHWGASPLAVMILAAGLVLIVTYTVWWTHNPVLCLVAPGLGFGPLMVLGTHYALTGGFTLTAFLASMIPFFLVSDLLLLNQFPDAEADRSIGRRHFLITLPRRRAALLYGAFLLGAYVVLAAGVGGGAFPRWSLLGLLTVPLAAKAFAGSLRHGTDIPKLVPSLGLNVMVNLLTPTLVAVGFLIGR